MKRRWAAALAMAMVAAFRAEAITVVPMTFEELVGSAAAVVYGRVADVRGQWTADRRSIDSIVTVEPLKYLKGDLGAQITLRLPGGEAGGTINILPGAPSLRAGDRAVLFIATHGPAIPTTLGLGQGVFRVLRDSRTGTTIVSPPPLKASDAGRILRGASGRRPLSLDEFDAAVRTLASAR